MRDTLTVILILIPLAMFLAGTKLAWWMAAEHCLEGIGSSSTVHPTAAFKSTARGTTKGRPLNNETRYGLGPRHSARARGAG